MGHGWVTPNEDGSKARCGGPAICSVCWREAHPGVSPKEQLATLLGVPEGETGVRLPGVLVEVGPDDIDEGTT